MSQDSPIPPVPPSDGGSPAGPSPTGPLSYAGPGGMYVGPAPTPDAKTMALLSHLLGILLGPLGPLLIWLLKKDSHPFVDDQGKEALNFQLTLLIAYVIGGVTACVFVGFFIILAAWICASIFGILATVKANGGEAYRYPFNIRLVK